VTPGTRALLTAVSLVAAWFIWRWITLERARPTSETRTPRRSDLLLGFVTNFFDTLGIGNFAPTTAVFKLLRRMPDEEIPGTLNAGHAVPVLAEALIFIAAVSVDLGTLVGMIGAAILGAWFGSGIVSRLPRRAVQSGMGVALLVAASLFLATNLNLMPGGGAAVGLAGGRLVCAVAANFLLGALMTLGVGLYAPCLILVSLLGMNPLAAFPIMMGSCAFLMPVAGARFIQMERYSASAAAGLASGGIPGVLLAAFIVKSLPTIWLRWLIVVVVIYAAALMLVAALRPDQEQGLPANR
jgi:uncharacterized membrane protein YfcA